MKKLLFTVGSLVAVLFLTGGCGMHEAGHGIGGPENSYKLVPRIHHEDSYPDGHAAGGERNCFYSQYDDAYLCPYSDR